MSRFGPPSDSLFGGMDATHGTDARILSRRSDPETSKQAAAKVSAKLTTEREYALACVIGNPGWTSAELEAHYRPHPEGRIRKRLAELERMGLVWRGVNRPCRQNGNSAAVWWPVTGEQA
jgi:hypothetical protein